MSENEGKKQFDAIEIPDELNLSVQKGMRRGKKRLFLRYASSSAAAVLLLVFFTANVPVLYTRAAEIPFLAPIVRMMRVGSGGSEVTGAVGAAETGEDSLKISFKSGDGRPVAVPVFSAGKRKLPERVTLRLHGMSVDNVLDLAGPLGTMEAVEKAYALSSTDPEEQGVIFHLNPGWDCAVMQYENVLELKFTWEEPEKEAAVGYILGSEPMSSGKELAELTEALLWEGATQLQISPSEFRVVLGEFSREEQAMEAQKKLMEEKGIRMEVIRISPENP